MAYEPEVDEIEQDEDEEKKEKLPEEEESPRSVSGTRDFDVGAAPKSITGISATPAPSPRSVTGLDATGQTSLPPAPLVSSGVAGGSPNPPQSVTGLTNTPSMPSADRYARDVAQGPAIAQKHGVAGGILKALQAIGNSTVPGIMRNIPGTQLNYNDRVGREQQAANEESKLSTEQGERGLRGAQTQHEEAATSALRNPPEKDADYEIVKGEDANGKPVFVRIPKKPGTEAQPIAGFTPEVPKVNAEEDLRRQIVQAQNTGDGAKAATLQKQLQGLATTTQPQKGAKEQIQEKLAAELAKPKPDASVVKGLQDNLRALDPFAADRLAASEDRAAAAETKQAEIKQEFVPAIQQQVVNALGVQKSTRRLLDILEPFKEDNTPFGSFWKTVEYRIGKAQADDIGQEIASMNLTGLQQAGGVLKTMGGFRAATVLDKVLQHTPDPLHDSVKNMYAKMVNIDRAASILLSDADKYGRKKGAELPPESMQPYKPKTAAPAGVTFIPDKKNQ